MPIEIVEHIIHTLWYTPDLSSDERTQVFCSLRLVNFAWSQTFMRFAQRDVYIPSPSFAEYYCHRFATIDRDENCRSLTFRVEPSHGHTKPLPGNTGEANARSISTLLYQADTLNFLPNLRRVTIEYIGTNVRDLYDQSRLLSMPKEVRHLEIKYSPQSHDTDYTIMAHQPIYLPNITKLSVS